MANKRRYVKLMTNPFNLPIHILKDIQAAINNTHKQGGIAVVNHLPWSLNSGGSDPHVLEKHPTLEQLKSWGIDAVEVVNGGTFDYSSMRWAQENGLGIVAGADVHDYYWFANFIFLSFFLLISDRAFGWTTLRVSNFSEEGVLEELRAKRTSIIYNAIQV